MLRPLETKDVEQIAAVHAADRDAGHFFTAGQPRREDADFRRSLSSVMEKGQIWVGDKLFDAEASIFEAGGAAAGFCLSCVLPPEVAAPAFLVASVRELHMASIYPQFRGQGCGKQLIKEWLDHLPSHKLLMARTLPASAHMRGLLVKRGFVAVGQVPGAETVLLRGEGHVVRKAEARLKAIKRVR